MFPVFRIVVALSSLIASVVYLPSLQALQLWGVVLTAWFVKTVVERRNRPPGPFPLPIIGNAPLFMIGDMSERVNQLSRRYGDIVELWLFGRRFVVVSGPEEMKKSLAYSLRSNIEMLGLQELHMYHQGIVLNQDLSSWSLWKQWFMQSINPVTMREQVVHNSQVYAREFSNELETLSQSTPPFNIYKVVLRFMLNVAFESAFGERMNLKAQDHFQEFFPALAYFSMTPSFIFNNITKTTTAHFREIMNTVVKTELGVMEGAKSGDGSFVSKSEFFTSISQHRAEVPELTDEQLRSILHEFMLGAIDASTVSCNIYWHLARNPDVLAKVREEIATVKSAVGDGEWTVDHYQQLKYCEQVIHETIRHSPSNPFTGRMNMEEDNVSGYAFPANTNFLLATEYLAQNGKYWKDPEAFRPERFDEGSPESVPKMNSKGIFFPFGGGNRGCAGKRVGIILVKTQMLAVCASWDVKFHSTELLRVWDGVRGPKDAADWVSISPVAVRKLGA